MIDLLGYVIMRLMKRDVMEAPLKPWSSAFCTALIDIHCWIRENW